MIEIKHTRNKPGSVYGYRVKGCRCPECAEAVAAKNRKSNPTGKGYGPRPKLELPPHGTGARYQRGCHCELCKEANRLRKRFFKDGTPKPRKPVAAKPRATPKPKPVSQARELRIVGEMKAAKPRTYEPEPDICGLELDNGKECRRRMPCTRPGHDA